MIFDLHLALHVGRDLGRSSIYHGIHRNIWEAAYERR